MAYLALYRKWRPGSFKDLVGQDHISKTLSQAIVTGKVGHAYLFSGPRGTGKTSTAKILAKALNCEQGPTPDPCGVCENCRKVIDGSSMDVFEIDAASNRGIDEIRDLRETVKFAPVDGRYKVYIVDEVHMLTTEAFNALLKTLEEPPSHVVFILATTEAHKVPATIQSRCQRYDFKRITVEEIQSRLQFVAQEMGFEAEDDALALIALQAEGGMRDALSLLDQCSSISEGSVTVERVQQILGLIGHEWIYRMTEALAGQKRQEILLIVAELLRDGKDLRQMLAELSLHLRSLMIYQAAGSVEQMDLYAEPLEVLQKQADLFSGESIMGILRRLHETMNEMKWSPQPRITVEVALLSLCQDERSWEKEGQDGGVTGRSGAAEEQRMAQLEAKLAQLTAALAQASKSPNLSVPAAKEPVAAEAVRRVPKAVPPQRPVLPDQPGDDSVWQELLAALRQQGKRSVVACVSQGSFAGMDDERFFLRFHGDILAQLAMRNYRKVIEELLAGIVGHSMQLVCSSEEPLPAVKPKAVKPSRRKPPEEPRVEVDLSAMPPDERANVQNAINILGDHFIPVEGMPTEEEPPPPGDEMAPPPEEE